MQCFAITHKRLRSKTSNAILSLKHSLMISDIDGIQHLLQMAHSLCHNVETFSLHIP